ncbi:YqeG family HAD IIIA-type phosphatase [Salinicoccus kekensis]|uniref:YqeG family HAD IIIA-type phosphatase n=1 Tax=Salinicoccus kekensis TaxID=714307 RepID=A0A285U9A3_9STAP|nr:YqeG family HAD IIIA-type phosphatase [Salinicoccus kekensis]SOC38490.1 hypothetical protein SAMN05878391_0430 [Salinicoccus kekensis]
MIKKYFLPTSYVEDFTKITPARLNQLDVKGIIIDLDNTLVGYDEMNADDRVLDWIELMRENGIKVTIVSNGKEKRVSRFAKPHDIDYIFNARKPLSRNYKKAISAMGIPPQEIIMVGDQLMTDILGANLVGIKSILVMPVKSKDGFATLLNRRIEKFIMRYFRKKGLLVKED